MSKNTQLYLASTSPRRKSLLTQIGINVHCLSAPISEEIQEGESPRDYADRLALAKAQAGWDAAERQEDLPVLGADTIVVLNDIILGKPKDKNHGVQMLLQLSGKTHEVLTSIAVVHNDHIVTTCSISSVEFREISPAEADAYWETEEPVDKAGGYAIQGKAAIFVKYIEGSYSGIMGLPLFETAIVLAEFGIKNL